MTRTRGIKATATAVLAAAVGVVLLVPSGTTTALWQSQVQIPGVVVEAGATEPPPPPPLDFGCDDLGDSVVQLVANQSRYFTCDLTIDLTQIALPFVVDLDYTWGTLTGGQFNSYDNGYQLVGIDSPSYWRSFGVDGTMGGSTSHLFYQGAWPPNAPGITNTDVPVGTQTITVRFRIHAVTPYVDPGGLAMSGGRMNGAVVPLPGDPRPNPIQTATGGLPKLWGGTNPWAAVQATSLALGTAPPAPASPESPAAVDPPSGPGPDPHPEDAPERDPGPDLEDAPAVEDEPTVDDEPEDEHEDEADEPELEHPDDSADGAHDEEREAT